MTTGGLNVTSTTELVDVVATFVSTQPYVLAPVCFLMSAASTAAHAAALAKFFLITSCAPVCVTRYTVADTVFTVVCAAAP